MPKKFATPTVIKVKHTSPTPGSNERASFNQKLIQDKEKKTFPKKK